MIIQEVLLFEALRISTLLTRSETDCGRKNNCDVTNCRQYDYTIETNQKKENKVSYRRQAYNALIPIEIIHAYTHINKHILDCGSGTLICLTILI